MRTHHLWRALAKHGDVKLFVIGDTPPYRDREMLREDGGALFPRRRFNTRVMRSPDSGMPAGISPPGLWEVGGLLSAWAHNTDFWRALSRADAFDRHQMNERRVARLVKEVRAFGPDLVVLCDTGMAPLLPWMKALGFRTVLGPHNLDSTLYRDIAERSGDGAHRRWAALVADHFAFLERTYLPLADQLWTCSHIDSLRFRDELGLAQARTVPNAIDVTTPMAPDTGGNLVYVGQMGYWPNEQAALALIDMAKRFARRGVPHTLHLVGRPTDAIRAAAAGAPNIRVMGPVPDTTPYLALASVVPVALRVGGGTRIKILEAMAAGRPVVSTPVGIEGIEATSGTNCIVADDPADFEAAVEDLLRDPDKAARIGLAGFELVRDRYSQEAVARLIGEHLREMGFVTTPEAPPRPMGRAKVVKRTAAFNRHNRLLTVRLLVRASVPLQEAALVAERCPSADLPNTSVSVGWVPGRGRPVQRVEVVAVLPPDVDPPDVLVRMHAYGALILEESGRNWDVVEEQANLIALTPEHESRRLSGLGWIVRGGTPDIGLEANSGGQAVVADIVETAPLDKSALDFLRFTLPYDPAWGEKRLSIRSGPGEGPSLTHLPQLWRRYEPSSRRLAAFRNIHAGGVAWLIGNGPSVRLEDLDRLRGEITFGFNRFHLAHGMTGLRPTYTVTGDRQMIEDFGQDIVDLSGGTVFTADGEPPQLVGDFIWLRQISFYPPLFSFDPASFVSPGGSSLFVAMQVAYFMGIRKFYIYGADFRFTYERSASADKFRAAAGDNNHFIPNYRSNRPWCPPSFRDICPAFLAARVLMESEGGWIRNVTRGGLLEIFERADFDAVAPSVLSAAPEYPNLANQDA